MAENKRPIEELNNPHVRHEERDINVRVVTRFGIALSLTIIASMLILGLLFNYFKARESRKGPPPSAGVGIDARKLPPEPRLQSSPRTDIQEMRAAEEQILHSYGWIDPDKGLVRIPIDRAIERMAQKGFPVRSRPAPSASSEVSMPTESGLGTRK